MFPTFSLFGRIIGSYSLCAIAGLLFSAFLAVRLAARRQIPSYTVIQAVLAAGIGLLLGSHLLYALTQLPTLLHLLTEPVSVQMDRWLISVLRCFSGGVYYGGFLGGLAGVTLYARRIAPEHRTTLVDLFALTTPLFHAFGRLGCFLGGCCYGIPCRFGILVEHNPLVPELNGVARFPVQLAEGALNLCLFFLLLHLFRRRQHHGQLVYWYLLLYPVYRFGLEFLRDDAIRGGFWGLSTSQWISILLFAVALGHWICRSRRS